MKSFTPKIIVSIAAVIFWLLIVAGQEYVLVTEIPLKVYEPRPEMTLGNTIPEQVNVRVQGPGHVLYFQRWSKKSSLILDVGTISDDQRISLKSYFEERPNQVVLQPDVRFLEIVYPDSIDIEVDRKISRNVPVKIMYDVSVRPGYVRTREPEARSVTLSGPEEEVRKIEHLRTEVFTRENADASFHAEIPVINPEPALFEADPAYVDVFFEIEMIGERSIHNIPVSVRNRPADLEVQLIPDEISLRITGGNDEIQELAAGDFTVYFDYLSQWFPNKNYYSLNIVPPEEVLDVIAVSPEKVEVVVIKE